MNEENKTEKIDTVADEASVTVDDLLKAGVHFGHKISRWHPSMKKFIFGERKGVHIINLNETLVMLEKTRTFIEETVAKNGIILHIGTRKHVQKKIVELSEETAMPYITHKWIGGFLTNWPVIKRQILKLKKGSEEKEKGEWNKYTKREQLLMERNLNKLHLLYGGVLPLEKLPDAMFIADCKENKTAIAEAVRLHIPIIAICDTNVDVRTIAYPIPSNDDGIKSTNLIIDYIKNAELSGRKKLQSEKSPAAS